MFQSTIWVCTAAIIFSSCVTPQHNPQTRWENVRKANVEAREPASAIDYIDEINNAEGKRVSQLAAGTGLVDAAARLEMIFEFARKEPHDFFAQLRAESPIFVSKGAQGKRLKKSDAIPNVYVVTRYDDVTEVLNQSTTFTVKPYAKIMDATVGSPFMLGRDSHDANKEKPAMRHALYNKNDLDKVRTIVAHLAKAAIAEGSDRGELDVVESVSRNVPLGVNDEYFGFAGPSRDEMAKWSRATQHAFFHNPFKDKKVDEASIEAGKEMREYVGNVLIPSRKKELANGRPANDTVSQILKMSQTHQKYGLNDERIVANVIGLLVGSVETTSAAIMQSLQILLQHPAILAEAQRAARNGHDELLSQFVWEALRFDPVNPWLARYAEKDYVIAKGTDHETLILKGSLVLASTESAMFDEREFDDPNSFRLDRDPKKYMHLGYGNHRCLGDDVSLVMVPETIKQLLLLEGLRVKKPEETVETDPFPESYVVLFDSDQPKVEKFSLNFVKEKTESVLGYFGLGKFVVNRIKNSSDTRGILKALKDLKFGDLTTKRKAIYDLPGFVTDAMAEYSPEEKIAFCMETNPKSKSAFPEVKDRQNYCGVRMDFRGCYFVERLLNHQSSYSSYYHCAYGRKFLSEADRSEFKQKFSHLDSFYFLTLE